MNKEQAIKEARRLQRVKLDEGVSVCPIEVATDGESVYFNYARDSYNPGTIRVAYEKPLKFIEPGTIGTRLENLSHSDGAALFEMVGIKNNEYQLRRVNTCELVTDLEFFPIQGDTPKYESALRDAVDAICSRAECSRCRFENVRGCKKAMFDDLLAGGASE